MRKKEKDSFIYDIVVGSMLVIVVGIMPLIVRGAFAIVPPESVDIFAGQHFLRNGQPTYIDVFSSWKSWFLGLPAAIIAFYVVSELITGAETEFNFKTFIKDPIVAASGIFFLFALLSAIFSDYTHTAWHGTLERNEGLLAWATYLIVFLAAMKYVRKLIHAKIILWALIFSSIIMGAVGLSQFLQQDLLATPIAQWLISGALREYVEEFTIRFTISFGTLYNPNTFGMYAAMMTPILLMAGMTYDGKKFVNLLCLTGGGLMLAGMFGSRSLAGFIGFGASLAVLIFALAITLPRRGIKTTDKRFWLVCFGVVGAVVFVMIFAPPVNERVHTQLERFEAAFRAEREAVYNYQFSGANITVLRDETPLFSAWIRDERDWIVLRDEAGAVITPERQVQDGFVRYTFELADRQLVFDHFADFFIFNDILFALQNETVYGISAAGQLIDMSETIPSFGFHGRERWGSSRGYIFSRSFPIMARHWFIGTGPDSFVNAFPQHDIVGKRYALDNPYIVVDKAHNVLIQTWITKGGIATLALIFLFGYYLVSTLKGLIKTAKDEPRFVYGLKLGLLAGVSAFCVASMSTDSTIGSSGVAFVILGLGYGINRIDWKTAQ
jgi:hypothetical protein